MTRRPLIEPHGIPNPALCGTAAWSSLALTALVYPGWCTPVIPRVVYQAMLHGPYRTRMTWGENGLGLGSWALDPGSEIGPGSWL